MWAIIGGSGFENFEDFQTIKLLETSTPFGHCSCGLKLVKIAGQEVLFLPRHGLNHVQLPQEINYRANIFALKKWGASKILSLSAVGSLREELQHGDLVVPHQYIDWTKSLRAQTFCGNGFVGYPSLANPTSLALSACLKTISHQFDFPIFFNKTYICIEGPHFSTRAESLAYRQLNADVVGMTNFPEYALAREAGLAYLPCTFITDYDSWNESLPHANLPEILAIMKKNNSKAWRLACELISQFSDVLPQGCYEEGLGSCLMTPWDQIDDQQKTWLRILTDPPLLKDYQQFALCETTSQ